MSRSKGHDVLGMDMSHLLGEVEDEIEHEKSDVTVRGSHAFIDEPKTPEKKKAKEATVDYTIVIFINLKSYQSILCLKMM